MKARLRHLQPGRSRATWLALGAAAGAAATALILVLSGAFREPAPAFPPGDPVATPMAIRSVPSASPLAAGAAEPMKTRLPAAPVAPFSPTVAAAPPAPTVLPQAPAQGGAPAPLVPASSRVAAAVDTGLRSGHRAGSTASTSSDPASGERDSKGGFAVAGGAILAPSATAAIPAAFAEPPADRPPSADQLAREQVLRNEFVEDLTHATAGADDQTAEGGRPDAAAGRSPGAGQDQGASKPEGLVAVRGLPTDPWERAARLNDLKFRALYGEAALRARQQSQDPSER